jgi:predicted NUDIX family NTP pyrophosphohydrolase
MAAVSAALCLWRTGPDHIEVLIVHPGGPFWAGKNDGAWSFPKGEFDPDSEPSLDAAKREFAEELGTEAPASGYVDLGETRLKSGKRIVAWAAPGDFDCDALVSNTFEIEWPPRSGQRAGFPEVDRAAWCSPAEAGELLNPAQVVFVERLVSSVG